MTGTPLETAKGGLDLCVHCGFCLQACPTYLALDDENDSPRGRLVLMRELLDGELSPRDAAVNTHISRCLGCRGCETACPSGVPFGHLLEATRATLREHRPIPIVARALLLVFSRRWLLAPAMAVARLARGSGVARALARLPGSIGTAFAMLAASAPGSFSVARKGAAGKDLELSLGQPGGLDQSDAENKVVLFEGCVMRELYAHVHDATRRTLRMNAYTLASAPGQRCCGALHAHAGDLEGARALARANVEAFEQTDARHIAANAAGCGAMLKDYPALFAEEPEWLDRAHAFSFRVRDITELLEIRGPAKGNPVVLTVAYDAPCHLLHAQRVSSAPLALFRAIPDLVVVQTPDSDKCCGAAGIYNLVEPETSARVLHPKLEELAQSGAAVVATGNPGCMMQIGAGLIRDGAEMEVAHPVELLDYSYGLGPVQAPGSPLNSARSGLGASSRRRSR